MKNKKIFIQKCGIKFLQIVVFAFAFCLIQTTATAQVALGKQNRISSVFSEKCLMAQNAVNREPIVQNGCEVDEQPFFFQFAGGETFQIKIRGAEKCMDVEGAATGNGTSVILWDCNSNAANQLWKTQPIGDGFQIKSVQSGKCLDVRGPSKNSGTPIQIWDCGNASVKQMIFKITDIDIISDGSTISSTDNSGNNLPLTTIGDAADKTSTLIDQFTGENAFESGNTTFFAYAEKFGKALKVFGAAAGLFDVILELAKKESPDPDARVLASLDKVHRKLDGLDDRQKREFDELKNFLTTQSAYQRLFKADNIIDSQYSVWRSNEISLKRESDTEKPEYKSANEFSNEASAIGNLCSGESGGVPIYDAVAEANNTKAASLSKLHVLISSKLSKAQTLGTYQRYRSSYLTSLKRMTNVTNLSSTGVENQIAEIERSAKANGSNINFEQLRNQHLESAKRQFAGEVAQNWDKCDKGLIAGVTKFFSPASVRLGAKKIVDDEFLKNSQFAADKLSLLLTDSNPDIYLPGNRGFGVQQRLNGSFDPSLAGGRFAAAIGKRLESAFPGYGFVVLAYANYDSMPTIPGQLSGNCSGVTKMDWNPDLEIFKSNNQPLIWKNMPVDGPRRICASGADQYSFNLIVSGFKRDTVAEDTKSWISSNASISGAQVSLYNAAVNERKDSQEFGITAVKNASNNLKPNAVSVFAALPAFANGRRVDAVYYLYPSKFPELVSYPTTLSNLFYVVSPTPF